MGRETSAKSAQTYEGRAATHKLIGEGRGTRNAFLPSGGFSAQVRVPRAAAGPHAPEFVPTTKPCASSARSINPIGTRTAATHVPAHAHLRPSFRPSSRRAAWRTRCARSFRSRLSSLAEGGHVLLGLTEQLAETLAARRSSLIAAILLVVGEDAPKACHVFRNPLRGEHCRCPVEGVLQRSEQSHVLTYRRIKRLASKKANLAIAQYCRIHSRL
jgi:hypothetical protein